MRIMSMYELKFDGDKGEGSKVDKLEQAFQAIFDGKALLITGAGANFGTLNIDDEQLPNGPSLAKTLYELAGEDDPEKEDDLQDAAENYIEATSECSLISFLQRKLTIKKPSESGKYLYGLPWLRIYTTNYDNLPLFTEEKEIAPVTIDTRPSRCRDSEKKLCVYINGYLGCLTEQTLLKSFKLTTRSYLSSEGILNSEWGTVLREDIVRASAVIVVGLSLDYDLDLQRIINISEKNKTFIIDAPGIKRNKKNKLSVYGNVYDIGLDGFVSGMREYYENRYIPSNPTTETVNFLRNRNNYSKKKATGIMIYDFLMWGKLDDALFKKKDNGENSIIYRSKIDKIVECVNNPNVKVVFIHSNLGNGKTVLIEQLKRVLYDRSIPCYEYRYKAEEALAEDLEIVFREKREKVVIIENYFNYLSLFRKFKLYSLENVTFILTARTMIYDTKMFDVLSSLAIEEGQSEILDINKLDEKELSKCYLMFDENKFWRKDRTDNKLRLKSKAKGNRELHTILLGELHSPAIQRKIVDLTKTIEEESGNYYKSIIMMLLSSVMSLELSVEDIQNILGFSCVSDPMFIKNPAVKELVEIDLSGQMNYRIRSSIVAEEILNIIDSNKEMIDCLISISKYANRYFRVSEKYEAILKNTVSFSHVNTFLTGDRDNIDFIISYYDALKTIEYYKDNSFFWLQYSIACMNFKKFELAQQYLDIAYELFRTNSTNYPFQCDNQQARLKLLMIKEGYSKKPVEDFREAHRLAMLPIRNEKDREESAIRLFWEYTNEQFINEIRKDNGLDIYRQLCGEAYNRVNRFLKNIRNERDKGRYANLSRKLLDGANKR